MHFLKFLYIYSFRYQIRNPSFFIIKKRGDFEMKTVMIKSS